VKNAGVPSKVRKISPPYFCAPWGLIETASLPSASAHRDPWARVHVWARTLIAWLRAESLQLTALVDSIVKERVRSGCLSVADCAAKTETVSEKLYSIQKMLTQGAKTF
jgi:hypothetical protein